MIWSDALKEIAAIESSGAAGEIAGVEYDSRHVHRGAAFVAMRGGTTDGNRFVDAAIAAGAAAIVTDSQDAYAKLCRDHPEIAAAHVQHGRRALAELSAAVMGHPERRLALSAVTGTNGKTTTAYLLDSLLRAARRTTVLIGTIETHVGEEVRMSAHTTPESRDILEIFADGVRAGASEAVMEMSSHALDQERVWGLPVDVAIFTNFTRDHLDYHGTMKHYLAAKMKLFEGLGTRAPRFTVINADDPAAEDFANAALRSPRMMYSVDGRGDFRAEQIHTQAGETSFLFVTSAGSIEIKSPLTGRVNVQNLLAAMCAGLARGLTLEQIAAAAPRLTQAPGRFQTVPSRDTGITVVVDYAHTDDALRNLIAIARELVQERGGRVITLFGCGGDRDHGKRPRMGRAAGEASDLVILTSDNPRSEEPMSIIAEALAGVRETATECLIEPDRAAAIGLAIRSARAGDIVLLAGKGHEKVQIFHDWTVPFDDVRVAAKILRSLEGIQYETEDVANISSDEVVVSTDAIVEPSVDLKLTLGQVADLIHAEGDFTTNTEAMGYSIDSRTIAAGEVFFAVRGERLDGHDFVEAALANGAAAAVVSMRWLAPVGMDSCKLLRVPDQDGDGVLASLQQLARAVRRRWGRRVIAITGSAGKTTTKDAVAQVLGKRFRVLKSQGNLNNGFGLPLQLLRLEAGHEVAVIEMGMSHAGEIAALARIAEPDWAVVSNIAPVHLEFFADGIDGIARAKYELIEALPSTGVAVLNCDDERVAQFAKGLGERAVFYGTGECAEVRAVEIAEIGADGVFFTATAKGEQASVHLHMLGRHNVHNAVAAIAVGLRSGMSLEECAVAVDKLRAGDKRGEISEWRGATVINDSYNSNPRALDAMADALLAMPVTNQGRHIVIAGEMLELGVEGEELHRACGQRMAARGVQVVVGVRGMARALVEGAEASGAEALFVATPEEAGAWLNANLRRGDAVLLKASRGVKLERALLSLED